MKKSESAYLKKAKQKTQQRPFSWMNPKLEVRDTQKYGKGVFAKKDIKKGDTLCVFSGYIKELTEEKKIPHFGKWRICDACE